ncbi:tRNA-dihydrouridine(47) synthase [NAD(P)(+)]-like isoform X2 [Topomyia yanbarensis]|uniref:tRNA-dihydrouridine(47) synthase [NAD(P)(+)]-like isoform X2 n=1 Tax=Topomyia yanbarensis TaxID=2498891 RepID=UPI00273B161C|nr:tRNA-dihydrouridine(47) synthase [NAD(P)(+)]-like isoform X2 [Topomyia yanbarensis]
MDDTVCYIKPEYLIPRLPKETDENKAVTDTGNKTETPTQDGPAAKKARYDQKKKNRGQNKNRQLPFKVKDDARLCKTLLDGLTTGENKCTNDRCRFSHDLERFAQLKPKDIGDSCYIYSMKGYCNFGVSCRFAGAHLDEKFTNKIKEGVKRDDTNLVSMCLSFDLQNKLRKRTYDFTKSDQIVDKFETLQKETKEEKLKLTNGTPEPTRIGPCTDEDLIKLRDEERKKINFKDKLYLSPLTTVGNLPFRRICKEYGVDITCGEMACAVPIIGGMPQEWALTKRHSSEDLFGVQLCGRSSKLVTYAAQVIAEVADVDFVDLNLGCPIDLIFREGGGSALLRRQSVLEVMIQSCSRVLADYGKEFTVKTRVGIYDNKKVAHELIPKFEQWGASLVTVHGRSKEQRYTKRADWEYIQNCAQQAKTIPIYGNGDLLSYQDYNDARTQAPELSGVMIGRGALIKPWLFREIKEQKPLDPSSSERMEMLKRYINYGLEHWGSDTKGVENTRSRFCTDMFHTVYWKDLHRRSTSAQKRSRVGTIWKL